MNFSELQYQEVENLYMMIATIYENLKDTPLVFAYRTSMSMLKTGKQSKAVEIIDLEDNKIVYDYHKLLSNVSMILSDVETVTKNTQSVAANITNYFDDNSGIIKRKEQEFTKFGKLFEKIQDVFREAFEIMGMVYKLKDVDDWFTRIELYHSKILKTYKESVEYIVKEIRNDEKINVEMYKEFLENYMMIYYFFMGKCDYVMNSKDSVVVENETPTKADSSKIMKFEYKPTTERELLVERANSMYEEFCIDLQDLDKQVPYSAREYYNEFVKMFENFKKQFKMPLQRNTKYATAKEAIVFMNKMLDFITFDIGENSAKTPCEWGN